MQPSAAKRVRDQSVNQLINRVPAKNPQAGKEIENPANVYHVI